MWCRRLALVALMSCTIASIGVGCGLVESFDGYSDRFDDGVPEAGGAGDGDDGALDADVIDKPDSVLVDVPMVDSPGVDTACNPVTCATTKGPLAFCSGTSCLCPSGAVECDGKCTYTDRDPSNCGGCKKPVPDGAYWCEGSVPTCRPGTDACVPWDTSGGFHVSCTGSASCTDMTSDGSHCFYVSEGRLHRCYLKDDAGIGPDGRCIKGECTDAPCVGPRYKDCPSTLDGVFSCFDIQHDSNNCGACFNKCGPTQVCSDGACVDYLPVKTCAECKDPLAQCCSAWSIPVCVGSTKICPATPG